MGRKPFSQSLRICRHTFKFFLMTHRILIIDDEDDIRQVA
ncbi:MAG: hypothetical protein QOI94_2824, partial [Acidobacteriaceae bacterium]|nr:hypothetical protein [Acidobacteriaceae bacterium]